MNNAIPTRSSHRALRRFVLVSIASMGVAASLVAGPRLRPEQAPRPGSGQADAVWKWSGSFGDNAVTLLIIGDIQIHERRADPTTAFVHLRDTLNLADLVYANLEGVLVKSRGPDGDIPDKKGWTHPGPQGVLALKAANVDVVGVANNVAYGRDNILETVRLLEANGIAHAGAGKNLDAAHRPAIVERKGVKIGFLQYTARWYRDDAQLATATAPGVAKIASRDGVTIDPADLDRLRSDIRRLRPQVDIVVVSHHNRDGATAGQFGPSSNTPRSATRADRTKSEDYQKEFAHVALDTGADLVFGHGTHTVQGVEVYKGKAILYAIGHSAFDQPGYENSKDGLVVRVVVQGKHVQRVSFVPVSRDAGNDVLMLDPSTGEGAKLVDVVKGVSDKAPPGSLTIDGHEVVLLDKTAQTSRKQENPRFGAWKLKSDAPAPASNVMTYEPFGGKGMKITIDAVSRDGAKSQWFYTTMFDGKDEPITGNPGSDTGAVRIIDDRINEIVYKKGDRVTQVLTNVLSPDGNTIGIIYMRMDAEGKTSNVTFATYERQR